MRAPAMAHAPVMLAEVLAALGPAASGEAICVDATFGCGGYSRALLTAGWPRVEAFDRDPAAVPHAEALAAEYPNRFCLHSRPFSQLAEALPAGTVAGIVFDLGVSSPQLDQAGRGFSFRLEGPLDMRMSQSGPTAADLVNHLPETDLAAVIYRLGEERHSRRIARAIVNRRSETPYATTLELAATVRACVPAAREGAIDQATRTFQALRMAVNHELEELEQGLLAAETVLAAGGRLVVVSFHSLEDRVVKDFMRNRARPPQPSRHQPAGVSVPPSLTLPHIKALRPDERECSQNPRARSARLRTALKPAAPLTPAVPLDARHA
jgi:16S rRNA (cytosine1402-N4)-methyltransferase